MTKNLVSFRSEDDCLLHVPPLSDDIVRKALSRETDMFSKQKEIYDVLVQSTEQKYGEDLQGYYARAHSIDPYYTWYLYNNYYNTDILDINEFILQLSNKLYESEATKAFVKMKGESHYKKTSTREELQRLLSDFLTENFMHLIEKKMQEIGINNLYTISISIMPSGLFLWMNAASDTDGDVMEKIDPESITKNDYHYPFPLYFDATYKLVAFIRKWSGEKGDISDCFVFE